MVKAQRAGQKIEKGQSDRHGKFDGRNYAEVVKMDPCEVNFPVLPGRQMQLQDRPLVSDNKPRATPEDLGPRGIEQTRNTVERHRAKTTFTRKNTRKG